MARLRVLKDGVEIQNVDLARVGKAAVMVGRAEGADIRLDDRAIGREHAVFLISSGGVAVQKKSKFGKLAVNGADVAESAVKPGDVINIADYQVRVEDGPAATGQLAGAPGPNISNEVTPPEGTALPAMETPPDVAAVPEGNTPGLNPLAAAGEPVAAEGMVAVEAPAIDDGQAVEAPAIEAPLDGGLGEQPTGGVAVDGGFAAEGGDRTAMISTAHVSMRLVFKPGEANVEEFVIKKAEIAIGRGTTCDVVITDKKSSRKHLIIKKVGMNFVAQDLGSGNGTYVNGNKITEQELAGEDVIRIGDTEFVFKAESKEYFQQEQNQEFIAPPPEEPPPEEAPADNGMMMAGMPEGGMAIDPATGMPMGGMPGAMPGAIPGDPTLGGGIPGMTGATAKPQTPPPNNPLGKIIWKFKQLPPKKQKIYGGVAVAIILIGLMGGEDEDPKKKKPTPKPTATVAASANSADMSKDAAFKALPPEKQQFVVNQYTIALDYYKKQDPDKALYELDKLYSTLPTGYKDSDDIRSFAKKAIEIKKQNEEEMKRKFAEEEMRKQVADLVAQAQKAFDEGKDAEAKDCFAKVLEKDPENPTILRLRQQMEDREQQKKQAEELEREKEFKKKQLQATLKEGQDLLAEGRYYETIDKMTDALTLFSNDPELSKQARGIIDEAHGLLKSRSKPHLDAAKAAFDGGDFQKAREEYLKALKVDVHCTPARLGIAQIRDIVHERSRKIYIEASVYEGVSDYRAAKAKYKECLDSAVREDSYFGMCTRKYRRFELIDRTTASSGSGGASSDPAPPKLSSEPAPDQGGDPAPDASGAPPAAAAPAADKGGGAPAAPAAATPDSKPAAPDAGGGW